MTRFGAVKVAFVTMAIALLALSTTCVTPTSAQTPFATPTPMPQVVQTVQTANTANSNFITKKNERDRIAAQLAEIDRNIENQARETERALGDARAASAAQNAAAFGEAIGRAEANLEQLKESNAAKKNIIDNLTSENADKDKKMSDLNLQLNDAKNKLNQANADRDTAKKNYQDLKAYQETHQNDSALGSIPALFIFIAFSSLIVILLVVVIANRREPPKDDPPPVDAPYTVVEDEGKPNDED